MLLVNHTYQKEWMKHFEGACTIGNGYLHIRGSMDQDMTFATQHDRYWRMPANVTVEEAKHPYSKWGFYIPGIVGAHPLLNEEMVNLPYPCGVNLYADGEPISLEKEVKEYKQVLDMEHATFEYQFSIATEQGTVKCFFERYADCRHPHILNQKMAVWADYDVELRLECFIDLAVTTNGYDHFTKRTSSIEGQHIEVGVTTDLQNEVRLLQHLESNGTNVQEVCDETRASITYSGRNSLYVERITSTATNLDSAEVSACAKVALLAYQQEEKPHLLHRFACEKSWTMHRVYIEGDDLAQQAMDFSVYHLLRSKPLSDRIAIDAKGAAGEAYFGHYFWDTEIYLLPFFLYTDPRKAKDLLMFRVHTLQAAMENALSYGYQGAKYPWESSISGQEQCPNWQYKDHEIHVSFDIVYAMQEYYRATKDVETCRQEFFPVVQQVAKFAISRGYQDKEGKWHLHGVMGPDEYIMFCDDNYYTNVMASFAVHCYLDWCALFDQPIEEAEKLRCQQFIEHMTYPEDQESGILWQCQNFAAFEDVDFEQVWKDRSKPFGAVVSQEHNYRTKALKQADVVSLFHLFDQRWSQETLQKNLSYYLPLTTHDSSLSYVIHSILFARLQDADQAYDFFRQACEIDLRLGGAAEGIHIANAGGLWQAIVFGFAGLQNPMWSEELTLTPCLPSHWQRVVFHLQHQGKCYQIELTHKGSNIQEVPHPYAIS